MGGEGAQLALELVASAAGAVAALVTVAMAGEEAVTLQGEVMCAMCIMKDDGAKECQNVLKVADGEESVQYYIVKNEVAEKFGHACSESKMAQVTGTVAETDGQMWLTATEMVPVVKKVSG